MVKKMVKSMLEADLKGKVVLVRLDHNVVNNGKIKDTMRIDATIPTLLHIFKKGGLPVVMTHVGRPFDKKTGEIVISDGESVQPIVDYLHSKLELNCMVPDCKIDGTKGITDYSCIESSINQLRAGKIDLVYLPNTRWFCGEEAKDDRADVMAKSLAKYADVFINDAFGSWQAHASTYGLAKYLPSYAGLLMCKEITHLESVFAPQCPMLSIVAGSKFDTKIGPLASLIKISDYLVLGGVIYNAYLCNKYGVTIAGVSPEDIKAAEQFMKEIAEFSDRIIELPYIIESDSFEEIKIGSWRVINVSDLKPGQKLNYVLDVAIASVSDERVQAVFADAKTIFINAVMGYTTLFTEGTKAVYSLIDDNPEAKKLFGGGDTIQEFKDLLPGVFAKATMNNNYYFFTGGGAILDAIEKGSPYAMKPVQMLLST